MLTMMKFDSNPDDYLGHNLLEDSFAILSSTLIAAFGINLLKSAEIVSGGTAGLTLLIGQLGGGEFGILYPLVSLPFLLLAIKMRGLNFTLRSILAVGLLSLFTLLLDRVIEVFTVEGWFAAIFGNLLLGVAMLMMFRHKTSLGGFNVIAILAQERLGLKAGYIQMLLDLIVVLGFVIYSPNLSAVWAALGVITLNLVLALNHRPDRYIA
jgi:uncharacterized membrane-anchored protein YitT (DUF2179 family)